MDLASYLFQTEPNIRVYIPCNVLGDGAVLLVDGVVRARRLHPHAPLVQFAKLAARGMVSILYASCTVAAGFVCSSSVA